ncbi:MAG TPA: LuxR C-terminal-related transcriptional regulator [Streptosporangiaceae bacterium]|nr:LuxR C-terminal-related transcriptional regulator [Streptosporangiaceae bacterium]
MRDQLVGRDEQLARVDAALSAGDEDADGAGPAHLVFDGTPGAGKTALLRATARRARRRGHPVVWARAHPAEQTFHFGVLRQLFDARAGAQPSDRPVLLAVDDVHWADEPSLEWLSRLARRGPAARVRIVATRSPGIGAGEFPDVLTAVPVPGLGADDVAALAHELLASKAAADLSFVRDIHRRANGNALLVTELLRAAAGTGELKPPAVPRRVGRWVTSRLGRLSADALPVARAIVILGEQAEPRVVAALAGLDVAAADAAADALARAGFLSRAGDPPRFTHPIVRDAIDELIAPAARRVAHAAAATILHEAHRPADVVAGHLLATDPLGRRWAAETLRTAAATSPEGAMAARRLRRALREPVDTDLRAVLRAELGHVELHTKAEPERRPALDAAVEHLTAAFEGARDAPLLAGVTEDLAIAHYLDGAPDRAMEVVDRTIAELSGGHHDHHDHHAPHRRHHRRDLVDRLAALALAMTGPCDGRAHAARLDRLQAAAAADPDLAVTVAAFRAGLAAVDGRPDEAVMQARRVAAAGPARTPRRLLEYSTAAAVLCTADVLGLAARCATGVIARGDETGPAGFAAIGHALAARVAFVEGRIDDAVDEARIAGATQFAVNGRAHAWARAWELAALLVKGDQNASAAILTGAGLLGERRAASPGRPRDSAGGDRSPDAFLDAFFLSARGVLRELRGDLDLALADHLDAGRRLVAAGIVNPAFVPWRSRAARVSLGLGQRDAAVRLAGEELALARRWGTPRAIGVALRALGVAAGGAEGLSLLEESVALLAHSPARVEHAYALYDLGRSLGEAGRREEARPLLHESYRMAAGCGARPLAERCAAEIKRVGGRLPRALPAGPAALTAQERRIAERAVAGATNREIAEELFLTLRTVEAHLTGVYRKLGITGRAQLAARLTD